MNIGDLNIYHIGDTIQMAGAIWQGDGKTFLCFFPKDEADLPIEILNMTEEDWVKFLRQTDILETEVLTKSTDGKLAKAILRKSTRQIDQNVSWSVYRRDKYRCRYCGNDKVPLTVDHLVCWEEGGPSIPENLVTCCKKCNRVRGDLPYHEWLSHEYYIKVSDRLEFAEREANIALLQTLDRIPRQVHIRSR